MNSCTAATGEPPQPERFASWRPRQWLLLSAKPSGWTMGTTSADYIKVYDGNSDMLAESLEAIQDASAVILAAILQDTERHNRETLAAAS